MYYDLDDRPMALSRGQYGVKHVDGKIVYLDINGNEMFDLNNSISSS